MGKGKPAPIELEERTWAWGIMERIETWELCKTSIHGIFCGDEQAKIQVASAQAPEYFFARWKELDRLHSMLQRD